MCGLCRDTAKLLFKIKRNGHKNLASLAYRNVQNESKSRLHSPASLEHKSYCTFPANVQNRFPLPSLLFESVGNVAIVNSFAKRAYSKSKERGEKSKSFVFTV